MKESITDDLDTKNKIFSINTVITLQKLWTSVTKMY